MSLIYYSLLQPVETTLALLDHYLFLSAKSGMEENEEAVKVELDLVSCKEYIKGSLSTMESAIAGKCRTFPS